MKKASCVKPEAWVDDKRNYNTRGRFFRVLNEQKVPSAYLLPSFTKPWEASINSTFPFPFLGLVLVEDNHCRGNGGTIEKILGKSDDGFEKIVFQKSLSYFTFFSSAKQNAVGYHGGHMFNEARIYWTKAKSPVTGWEYSVIETAVVVFLGHFPSPVFQGERVVKSSFTIVFSKSLFSIFYSLSLLIRHIQPFYSLLLSLFTHLQFYRFWR